MWFFQIEELNNILEDMGIMNISIENIKDITFGAESIEEENDYIVFPRFTENEKKVYTDSSDLKIKTLATAGVRLDFYTDADIISFDYKMIRASSRNLAFFDVYIDNMFAESVSHNDIDFEFTDKFSKSLKKGRKRITIFFLTYLICKSKTSN